MRLAKAAAVGATLVAIVACRTAAPQPQLSSRLRSQMDMIVEAFRHTVILIGEDVPPDDHALVVGRLIFHQNAERLARLVSRLRAEPRLVPEFLALLENVGDWHDADRLAFEEVLEELPRSDRVEEDRRVLARIKERYAAELSLIGERLKTRGMAERREKWDRYVAFLRSLYRAEQILSAYSAELKALAAGVRGRAVPWGEGPREITGRGLPSKRLVLTFDDGPHPQHTAAVLQLLQRFRAPALFFEVGRNIERSPAEARKLAAAGHVLANHSFSHAFLPRLSDDHIADELNRTNDALRTATGSQEVELFRPPYGARNERVSAAAVSSRMVVMLWNIDSMDWADPIPQSIAARVVTQARREGRGIILMHDIHRRTVDALPMILESLRAEGFEFVSWDQQFRRGPGR